MHNSFFTTNHLEDQEISNIRNFILETLVMDDNCVKFTSVLDTFISNNEIPFMDNELCNVIIHNYWLTLLIYHKNKELDTPWSDDTLWNYLIVMIRIIELALYICKTNNLLTETFFNLKDKKSLFEYFHTIKANMTDEIFTIKKIEDKTKAPLHIFLNYETYYRSQINIMSQDSSREVLSWFEYYFKINNEYMIYVHNIIESQNKIQGRNSKGQKGVRIPFQTLSLLEMNSYRHGIVKDARENRSEDAARDNKLKSVAFINGYNVASKNLSKYDISSKFKQFQINQAIGAAETFKNLNLLSNYYLPNLYILQQFLQFDNSNQKNKLENKLICLSIFFGISIEKLIYTFLNLDHDIKFVKNSNKLVIGIPKDIFAATYNLSEDMARKITNSKNVEIFLNEQNAKDMEYLSKELPNIICTDEEFFQDDIAKLCSNIIEVLNINKKKFHKHININIKTLPSLSLKYFTNIHNDSDISLLLLGEITKSNKARMCYVSQRKRLYKLESWIEEFQTLLLPKNTSASLRTHKIEQNNDDFIGSPMTVTPSGFKNFLTSLLSIQSDNNIINANLNMIALRYLLGIQMATRDFDYSCNLYNLSRREKILFLQEKNRDLVSSKRIIPLSNKAIQHIEFFYTLKEKYNLDSFMPVLLVKQNNKILERVLNKNNTKEFLDTLDTNIDLVKEVKLFIDKTKLNFGRHIFSTHAVFEENLHKEYLDAFLNHFQLGVVDQGIFSNFNNREYSKAIVDVIQNIEELYFPKYINLKG